MRPQCTRFVQLDALRCCRRAVRCTGTVVLLLCWPATSPPTTEGSNEARASAQRTGRGASVEVQLERNDCRNPNWRCSRGAPAQVAPDRSRAAVRDTAAQVPPTHNDDEFRAVGCCIDRVQTCIRDHGLMSVQIRPTIRRRWVDCMGVHDASDELARLSLYGGQGTPSRKQVVQRHLEELSGETGHALRRLDGCN
jgi:hypothetical protein